VDDIESEVMDLAIRQDGLVSRQQALALGMHPGRITRRLQAGRWTQVHLGVYRVGPLELDWRGRLRAACLAAAPGAVAAYRGAGALFGLDPIKAGPIEVTVPHSTETNLVGVITHRSRRLDERDRTEIYGIPVTSVPRTLLDLGRFFGPATVEKSLESAIRRGLTTEVAVGKYLTERGELLPGWRVIHSVLRSRAPGRPAGSAGEVELLRALRRAGVPAPIRQYELRLPGEHVAVLDFAWPDLKFALEYDGYDFHGGRLSHAADLDRQNAIQDAGWELRRYSGTRVRRDPAGVATEVVGHIDRLQRRGLPPAA
jgi:hypothetical protein